MAHDIRKKAEAMAALLTGDRVRDVARSGKVPERTVRRWREDAWQFIRAALSPTARAELAALRAIWPGLHQNGRSAWGVAGQCNAKTRSGGLCRNWPMHNGRCRMHGGRNRMHPDASERSQ